MSRPASASGSVAAWIGNGAAMPALVSAATSGAGTPSEAKVTGPAGLVRGRRAALNSLLSWDVKESLSDCEWPCVQAATSVETIPLDKRGYDRRALMAAPNCVPGHSTARSRQSRPAEERCATCPSRTSYSTVTRRIISSTRRCTDDRYSVDRHRRCQLAAWQSCVRVLPRRERPGPAAHLLPGHRPDRRGQMHLHR